MGPNPIPVCPYAKRKSEHGADTEGRQYEVTQGECHVKTEDGMTHLQAKEHQSIGKSPGARKREGITSPQVSEGPLPC